MLYAMDSMSSSATLIEHAEHYERSWHVIHADIGPVLCCVWYRPPQRGEVGSIRAFASEWARLKDEFIGTILVGDLNLHHTHWLKFSSCVSVEGTSMYRFCCDYG